MSRASTQLLHGVKLPVLVPIMDILSEVADRHNIPAWRLRSSSRKAALVRARAEFAVLAERAGYTHEEIAEAVGRERSTLSTLIKNHKTRRNEKNN